MKKILSIMLAVVMVMCMLPFSLTASAETSGTTGDCTWTLDGTTLTISGNGEMGNYELWSGSPWRGLITKVIIEDGVTRIGGYAFVDCTELTSITIPNSVTSIGWNAFSFCTSLTSITIPESVINIGSYAFENCIKLSNITIPNSVTSISQGVFTHCENLLSIIIPNSVTSIGSGAFSYCTGLTSITVEEGNTVYHSKNNCLIETESKTLILGCKNSNIPSDGSVTSIEGSAFRGCTGLTSITIPNSVTSIGSYAFSSCYGLTSITIPNSVTSIGEEAFAHCTYLSDITFSDNIEYVGYNAFDETAWYENQPDGIIYVGSLAYELKGECPETVIIKDGTKIIESYLFQGCETLKNITISDSVTNIGYSVFEGCTGIISITVKEGNTVYHSNNNCLIETESKELILGCENSIIPTDGSVTSIGGDAFSNCTGLTSITIPNSIIRIAYDSFSNCTNLSDISFSDNIEYVGYNAFDGTAWYENQPDGIIYVGKIAYRLKGECTENVVIKDGTKIIGERLIDGRENLKSVTIPSSVTSIGRAAFRYCTGLTSITIPESVTTIGGDAFGGCTNLSKINITDSIIDVGNSAFDGTVWYDNQPDGPVYVGKIVYKCKGNSIAVIDIKEGTLGISNYAFAWCTNLENITIPNSVTSIGQQAFDYCIGLTDVYYEGSEEDRNNLEIGEFGNDYLLGATWHYNYIPTPEIKYGLVTENEEISASDALTILHAVVGKVEFTDAQNIAGDVDGDGKISATDALTILHFVVGKIDKFPVEG